MLSFPSLSPVLACFLSLLKAQEIALLWPAFLTQPVIWETKCEGNTSVSGVGDWVLEEALCSQSQTWDKRLGQIVPVSLLLCE